MEMPADNFILLSIANMKLRDGCPSLESLCEREDWDGDEVLNRLEKLGYVYDEEKNTFKQA